ncbi:MAG TPA: hypothetical protein VFX95_05450, partial [Caulobacteraceae bacterium]|nr:hypothetical protein [Caulobacteraceae bacterium]
MVNALIPWMNAVREGGLSSISGEFSIYTPPYVYLLYLANWLVPLVGTVAAIKLINVPFVALLALATYDLVAQSTRDVRRAAVAGAAVCVAPTVLVNAFAWGQADVVYTAFVLLCVTFASRRAWTLSAVFFGVALSFKLQAVFISPLLLYLVLSRQMKARHLGLAPLTYLAMMAPAWLAGRPWGGMLKTYFYQAQTFEKLAVSAPNPWFFFDYLFIPPPQPVYVAGVLVGLALASVAGLLISFGALRLRPGPHTNLLIATLCAGLMPYLLPKMHDRYFFVADVLTIAFAFAFRRYWIAALLFQAGSLITYLRYFGLSHEAPAFGFLPVTLGVCTLVLAFIEMQRQAGGITVARSGRRAWGKALPSSPGS